MNALSATGVPRQRMLMQAEDALAFIRDRGVVLASAKGPVPRMAEIIVGEAIKGSWWGHPNSHHIFAVFQFLAIAPDILVCRVVGGKVTLVHRRLWPALIRSAGRFPAEFLAQTNQEHTEAGHHIKRDVPFPDWADLESMEAARALSEPEALAALGTWASMQDRSRA